VAASKSDAFAISESAVDRIEASDASVLTRHVSPRGPRHTPPSRLEATNRSVDFWRFGRYPLTSIDPSAEMQAASICLDRVVRRLWPDCSVSHRAVAAFEDGVSPLAW